MPIITISRGSYSKGKEVAEKVAQKLGYECISREIILEASEEFHVPEIKLMRAIRDAPGILDRLSHKKDKYIAYIQTELLKHFCKDNIVYHGLAGQYFVKGISHVLKVRIIADMEDRVRLEMERERTSRKEAIHTLNKDDYERAKWSQHLYGIDPLDSSLYDMVLHIHKISVDDAVDIICHTAGLKDFQITPESKRAIDDLFLAAEVKSAVIDLNHDMKISAKDGIIFLKCEASPLQQSQLSREINKAIKKIPNVKEVRIDVEPIFPLSE
jgi:cytidylate kinase